MNLTKDQQETTLPAGKATYLFPFSQQESVPDLFGLAPVKALPVGHEHAGDARIKKIGLLKQRESGQAASRNKVIWLVIACIILLIAIFFILFKLFMLLPGSGVPASEGEKILSALGQKHPGLPV